MTVDIAQLGLEVQSASVKQATMELKEFATAAVVAEESTDRISKTGVAMNRYFSSLTGGLNSMRAGIASAASSIRGGFNAALNGMKNALSGGAMGLRNVAFQFNQVAQMGAVTGNYLQALLIQLPDLLGSFGLLGIALGIVAGAMAPFILSLFDAEDASKALTDAQDRLAEATDNFIASAQAAAAPISELREQYGQFADEVQRALEAVAAADQLAMMNELKATIDILNESLLETVTARQALAEGTEVRRLADDFGLLKSQVYAISSAMVDLENASSLDQAVGAASRLMNALDSARDSAGQLPPPLQAVYDNVAKMVPKTAEAAAQLNKLPAILKAGENAASLAAKAVASIGGAANSAYGAIANLVGKMREMAEARAKMFRDSSLNYGKVANSGGVDAIARAGNLASFGMDLDGELAGGAGGVFKPTGGGGGGGGGGAASQLESELEQLRELYADKATLELESYQQSQDTLREALDQKLLTQQEYNELMEELQRDHAQKMSEIDVWRYGDGLQKAGAFFGAMADALANGNEKMQKISRIFAAAEALVNTYRAAAQTLADPKLGFFAKFAAVASVISTGMGLVNAIRSGSSSARVGGRGGGGVSTTAPSEPQQAPQRVLIDGVSPGQSVSYETLDQLFNLLYNKNSKRGVVFQLSGA